VWHATLLAAVAWVATVGHPGGPVSTEIAPSSAAGTVAEPAGPAGSGPFALYRKDSFYINGEGGYGRESLKVSFSVFGLWRTATTVCGQIDGPCIDAEGDRVVVRPLGAGKYQLDTIPPLVGTGYQPPVRTFIVGYSLSSGSRAGWLELVGVAALLCVTAGARAARRP
jgi:hypothetical protein